MESSAYCDVSLPVPLDRPFTYHLPETLRHRAQTGSRITVPFGPRKLTGVILRVHDDPPEIAVRDVYTLLDEEPVLDAKMIALAQWIAGYYCAPLGEVLRGMVPLGGEIRKGKLYALTDEGRAAARQLFLSGSEPDAAVGILKLLESRPLSASYLSKKFQTSTRVLKTLEKRGFVEMEDVEAERDPLRAASARLRVDMERYPESGKFSKYERELLAYLELHPGTHNLADLETQVTKASQAARSLARKRVLVLGVEPVSHHNGLIRAPHALNPHQQAAFDQIRGAIEAHEFKTFLLQGVTGSGKTEVYLKAIDAAIASGRGALLLVPEIGLTPAVAGQFSDRFGDRMAILHSAFNDSERAGQWRRIRSGAASVVVGTRSGVFAPVRNLGLILVDEEHDNSYKQQETPRYHGRDVAIVRAQAEGACIVLGSATPSLESRYNVERGKYTLLSLPERIEKRPMPEVEIVDMRREFLDTRKQNTFSRRLVDEMRARLDAGEQTMLLLNRRGFSSFVACRACGERVECVNCSVTLTYHRRDRRMLCHYCNYAEKAPSACPKCASEYIQFIGLGSERVEEDLHREFPKARIARMDRDTVSGKRQFETILHQFRDGHFDILVGTQMIAKGHDIPNVTLVGIINADIGLGLPDFRAAERTFQLLTQAAGRAGRGGIPGLVLMQTINPEHYAVRYASEQNYDGFYEKELQFRRTMRYPPFAAMANILVRATKQEDALRMSGELGNLLNPAPENIKVLGPAEAPVVRLKNEFRYQLLIKAASRKRLNELLNELRQFAAARKWPATSLVVDVDPITLL
jgi:primosomal protein N' (replication factor Y) (superfamily II helicase)